MSESPFSALFDEFACWQVFASGQAEGSLSRVEAPDGRVGLRLDYDFHGGAGFVAVRRLFAFVLPDTFEIGFLLRGTGLTNTLEFKVASPGGADVWRHACPNFEPPAAWSEHRFTERDLAFAWGPSGGGAPSAVEAVELVVVAGPGGQGTLEFAAPVFEDQTLRMPASVRVSSAQMGCSPETIFSAQAASPWRASPGDVHPWLLADFGASRRFGGLVVRWPEPLGPRAFEVLASDDGQAWRRLYRAAAACGRLTHIPSPLTQARFLKWVFERSAEAAVCAVSLRPDAFSHTPNAFIHAVAADFPRGGFPRYWLREQSYWTVVGTPEGTRRALINEEGLVETDEAGFSLEPFVLTANGVVTWAKVETSPRLAAGGLPVPSVEWTAADFGLSIRPWVDGAGDGLTLRVAYRLVRRSAATGLKLVVAVRPYQVTPPWQAFRNLGGRSPVHRILCDADGLRVDDRRVLAEPRPDAQGATAFEGAETLSVLTAGRVSSLASVDDASGLASAEMLWSFPEGRTVLDVTVSVPFFSVGRVFGTSARTLALARWHRALGRVSWRVPACAAPAIDQLRSAAGHILINRDGPALQPGPRRYTRSWIRDGVIMGAALAKVGRPEALRDFLLWYAPFQRDDGFVPCVVDRDGVDGLVEHDSHGQFLWGVREGMRGGGSAAFLKRLWPHVRKASEYLVALRNVRTAERSLAETCEGLLPESASHEGYLAHPVHSYWDDFWGVRGLEAAADLAALRGADADAERWRAEAARFQNDLVRSLGQVIADKKLAYIPGSVEWADFDPTATSNAVALLDFADALPQKPLRAMLATYLDGVRHRRAADATWVNYTAYEVRLIGAFARLGERDAANELLSFFLSDRRPCVWNQWPEITWRDPRSPGHLGDLPHTWIAAEYVLSLLAMVASERESSDSLVLGEGLPWAWIAEEDGFTVRGLPTRYGRLDFSVRALDETELRVVVGGLPSCPAGGLRIVPPLPQGRRITAVSVRQGAAAVLDAAGGSVAVTRLPFEAELRLG